MFDVTSPSEGAPSAEPAAAARAALQRARGEARVAVARVDGRSRLADLRQSGAAKCLLPKITDSDAPEAVLLNTAGGITGGDRFDYACRAEAGAALTATTQAAERVYRAAADDGRMNVRLDLAAGARLHWLPQETILFDGGRLRRRLEVDMAADAELIALETILFGRRAMGERVTDGFLSDQWRVRRAGRLIFAEALRVAGPIADTLARSGVAQGGTAVATLLLVASDAEDRLEKARADVAAALEGRDGVEAALSAWNGLMTARFAAPYGAPLRAALIDFLTALRGAAPPRVWRL